MPQNNNNQTPRNLQGGPSFTYGDRGSNPRKRPADIDEIIHFVRTQGIMRETTEMRLNQRAPLPGIGQKAPTNHHRRNSYDQNRIPINQNANSLDTDNTEGTDEAYEFDAELADYPQTHRSLSPASHFPSNGLTASQVNILSKSMEAQQFVTLSPIKPIQGKRVRGSLDPSPTRNPNRRSVRTLPPMLQHERPLHRPTAPSPSITPPLSRSDEEDEEDFIET